LPLADTLLSLHTLRYAMLTFSRAIWRDAADIVAAPLMLDSCYMSAFAAFAMPPC